jgi:sialic acid synthase SpsE
MAASFSLAGRRIGDGEPSYVIAELSGNHNGEIERAFEIIEAAKQAGADAVKLQTYRADTITIDHDGPEFRLSGGLWDGRRLYELYEEAHTPWEWHAPLFAKAREVGITIFSAPFDPTAIDLLESLDAPAYKIASPEIVDTPLIRLVAATGKPMIISTGMANLATIKDLADRLGVLIGLSDHTLDTLVSAVAVGMGADLIEKHVTLARADGGVDSAFSLEPDELARLVRDVRTAKDARGEPNYRLTESEKSTLAARRSLYVVADMAKGDAFTPDNVRSIRPNSGLMPKHLPQVLGRTASRDLKRGHALAVDMVDGLDIEAGAGRA